jgi:hypothetical protein
MSHLSTVSKCIILTASLFTLSITSINCYHEINAVEFEPTPVMGTKMLPVATNEVRIDFEAVVTSVKGNKSALEGAVNPRDKVSGFLVNDEDKADANPDPTFGVYEFEVVPSAVQVRISGLAFRSTSDSVDINVNLDNDNTAGGLHDSCGLRSFRNLDVLPEVSVNSIEISLRDNGGTVLSSDELRGTKPFLHNWPIAHELTIKGKNWKIEANITSFSSDDVKVEQKSSIRENVRVREAIDAPTL